MLLTSRRSTRAPPCSLPRSFPFSPPPRFPRSRRRGAADEMLLPYTVTPHDTLIGLNRTLFTAPGAWQEVSRLNHLPDSNRIQPGQVLQVPARLLHNQVVPARLLSAFGDVRIGGKPAAAGATFNVGDTLRTGESSTAVVQLADGSHVKLAPDTEGRLDEQRRSGSRPPPRRSTTAWWPRRCA